MNEYQPTSQKALDRFTQEASQRLAEIETGLLNIENGLEIKEQIRLIFRGFHGLKGLACHARDREMVEIANAGETLLSQVRDHGREFRKEWVDLLLNCHDDLKELLDKGSETGAATGTASQRLSRLNQIIAAAKDPNDMPDSEGDFLGALKGHVTGLGVYLRKWAPGVMNRALAQAIKRKLRIMIGFANSRGRTDIAARISHYLKVLESESDKSWQEKDILEFCDLGSKILEIAERHARASRITSKGTDNIRPRISRRLEVRPEYVESLEALVSDFSTYTNRLSEDLGRMNEMIKPGARPWLKGLESDLRQFAAALRLSCKRLRLTPISGILDRFPRLARDIAKRDNKDVTLQINGGDIELKMEKAERLAEPLAHLVRNAVDHGIESPELRAAKGKPPRGAVSITVVSDQKHLTITVADDGQGIDFARIRQKALGMGFKRDKLDMLEHTDLMGLIFLNGMTTQEDANTISGRGVGMDIVKESLSELNGAVRVISTPGQGSEFILTIPVHGDEDSDRTQYGN
jgi:chemotaxis protein histidine kinase CheA